MFPFLRSESEYAERLVECLIAEGVLYGYSDEKKQKVTEKPVVQDGRL